MVVVYYTLTHFLDAALETIQSIKHSVTLHVVIEITPFSKKSTVVDVERLDDCNAIENCEMVIGEEKWKQLKPYFDGVASVSFAVYKRTKSFSLPTVRTAIAVGKFIKSLNAEVVHFDSVSPRVLAALPYIQSKKLFITIHDPQHHSGEYSWRKILPRWFFFKPAKGFFFYSHFACQQFIKYRTTKSKSLNILRFQPFTYISQFMRETKTNSKSILFFGRLSQYKGIDLLLDAIPQVIKQYPDEKFVIAGSSSYNYKVPLDKVSHCKNNVELIEKYLTPEELAQLIQDAKFLVCPYRDATQSGVIMTAFAAKKIVVATNVGAFPEYVIDGVNGLLTDPDPQLIAEKILQALEMEKYLQMEKTLDSVYSENINHFNRNSLLSAYGD